MAWFHRQTKAGLGHSSIRTFVTRAGKMSQNAHRLILSYTHKKVKHYDFSQIWGFHKNVLV